MNARDPLHRSRPTRPSAARPPSPTAPGTSEIVPQLTDYIAMPAKSPMFDADWQEHGYIDRVVRDAARWVERSKVAGLKLEVDPPRTAARR